MNHAIKLEPMRASSQKRAALVSKVVIVAGLGVAALLGSFLVKPGSSSAGPAGSADPAASAPASAAVSAGPAAGAPASEAGPTPLPKFDAEPFSAEKSPAPTPADWKPTTPVALTDPLPHGCKAYRVREWVKIRCSQLQSSEIAMLTGDREGVMLFIDPPIPDRSPASPGGEIVFPVRRGDRRVFEWSTFGESYEGPGFPELAFLISESWAPDEPSPRIIAH